MATYPTELLVKHLGMKWKGAKCPLCGEGNWQVSDKVFELREFNNGNLVLGTGPIVPVIPVTCGNCGNTVFINAVISEVIELKSDKDGKNE